MNPTKYRKDTEGKVQMMHVSWKGEIQIGVE